MRTLALSLAFLCALGGPVAARTPQGALFVGIDVSGSFYKKGGVYEDALDFLAHYLYGHLHEAGGLEPLKALFVGTVGGAFEDETKAFRPIHDFQDKSVDRIHDDLMAWFPKSDRITDFNTFFRQVAIIAQKRNLALTPITIVLLSDGLQDMPGMTGRSDTFSSIDLSPIEYLSRRVTVRLLYASPVASNRWETVIPRKRVRMWTVDQQVMAGWRSQLEPGASIDKQEKFWKWVQDNIDFRVRPVRFLRKKT
jgi:hypothetical protein